MRHLGIDSCWHHQAFGIAQGCPLSPSLFSIVMTCLLFDANKRIENRFGSIRSAVSLTRSLLYADDTLIIEAVAGKAQAFMEETLLEGKKYALEFNNAKLEALQIGCDDDILNAFGGVMKKKNSLSWELTFCWRANAFRS